MTAEDFGEGQRSGSGRQGKGLLQACHQVYDHVTLFTISSATCLQPAGAVCLQTPTVKVVLLQTSFWPQAYQGTYMACPWMRMPYSMIHVQGSIEAFQCP